MNYTFDINAQAHIFFCHFCEENKEIDDMRKEENKFWVVCNKCGERLGNRNDFIERGILWLWENFLKG